MTNSLLSEKINTWKHGELREVKTRINLSYTPDEMYCGFGLIARYANHVTVDDI